MMPAGDIDQIEALYPGFIRECEAMWSSEINAAARKRYGNAGPARNHIPFGQNCPALVAQGLNPPQVNLIGRPVLGSFRLWIEVIIGGQLGEMTFVWSQDGGVTWTPNSPPATLAGASPGITSSTPYRLGSTGMLAEFPTNAVFTAGNLYQADTPVPGAILSWLSRMMTVDCYMRRGANAQDPGIQMYLDEKTRCLEQLEKAANGKDGLLDLPMSEDLDSAVTTGGVLGYSESSPYVWTDIEAGRAHREDCGER